MQTHPRKLIVVICEAALQKPLAEDARQLGAAGYTIADVRRSGRGGTREGAWEADRSIEMKVIGDAAFAERFAAHVLATYWRALFGHDVSRGRGRPAPREIRRAVTRPPGSERWGPR